MSEQIPATPAPATPAATPGSDAKVITTPSNTTPNAGQNSEGTVTITTKEFAQLNRDAARARSADRRNALGNKGRTPAGTVPDNLTPDAADLINQEREGRLAAERKAAQAEVREKVRGILDKDEFKGIPQSTKDLILRNPGAITEAEDPDIALLDVEDYLRDVAGKIDVSAITPPGGSAAAKPQDAGGRETPPVITPGAPAPSGAAVAEDPSKLRGAARTQAMVRNKLRGVKPGN